MATNIYETMTPAELRTLASEAMDAGHYGFAERVYEHLIAAAPELDINLRVRHGIAGTPETDTPEMVAIIKSLESKVPSAFVGSGLATWRKTLPFYDDERFMQIAQKNAHLLPLPNWHWNLQTVLWAAKSARDVPGDFVELGVFKGHTTLFLAEYLEFQTWPKAWRLYDTFEGIPQDQLDPGWAGINQGLYKGTFSFDDVAERFAPFPNIEVIKGRAPEVLAEGAPEQIAFLHIDLNNSTAEIAALDVLFDRISPGGVIVFDDFCWRSARAQYQAERAWFAARGLEILPLPTGQGLFVKR